MQSLIQKTSSERHFEIKYLNSNFKTPQKIIIIIIIIIIFGIVMLFNDRNNKKRSEKVFKMQCAI